MAAAAALQGGPRCPWWALPLGGAHCGSGVEGRSPIFELIAGIMASEVTKVTFACRLQRAGGGWPRGPTLLNLRTTYVAKAIAQARDPAGSLSSRLSALVGHSASAGLADLPGHAVAGRKCAKLAAREGFFATGGDFRMATPVSNRTKTGPNWTKLDRDRQPEGLGDGQDRTPPLRGVRVCPPFVLVRLVRRKGPEPSSNRPRQPNPRDPAPPTRYLATSSVDARSNALLSRLLVFRCY